jgi:D-amino-acid dehydrogenase
MSTYDAVVVGGGIIGSSVAYHLARNGSETILLDRNDEGAATVAGAGIVFPPTSSRAESNSWFRFALEAADYYPELAAAIDDNEYDHGYARPGLIAVAVDEDEVKDFEQATSRIERRTEEYGRPRADRTAEVSADRARELYPLLANVERAIHYEDAARVDGRAFATALREAGTDAGLTVRNANVTELRLKNGTVRGVTTAGGNTYEADTVVIAGGAWSKSFERDLGIDVPVTPKRGQIVHLDVGSLEASRPSAEWPIVKAFRHQYQVPWPDDRVVCGATRESGSGFEPHVTLDGLREVSTEALRIAPGLTSARHVETRVGLRPTSSDGLPLLGPVPGVDGAFLATGHGAAGLTIGPYSGKVVAELVRGAEPTVDWSPFRVGRVTVD